MSNIDIPANGEPFPFEISVEDIIRFLGPDATLYSKDEGVFIRELYQNALDAILVYRDLKKNSRYAGVINITYQPGLFTIEDNGIGLDKGGMKHLAHPLRGIDAYFGKELSRRTKSLIIGHFGAGLLSVFKVSDKLEVESQKRGELPYRLVVDIEWEKGSGNTDKKLKLNSVLYPSSRDREGTVVKVRLGSPANEKVLNLSKKIDSEQAVVDTIKTYILHPLRNTRIKFKGPTQEFELKPSPYLGKSGKYRMEVEIDGVQGYISYDPSAQGRFRVCQRGILVNDNYSELIENTKAIIGEIDILRTDMLSIMPSREKFVDNENLIMLKKQLAARIDMLMKEYQRKREAEEINEDKKDENSFNRIAENSSKGLEILSEYINSNSHVTQYEAILKNVTFRFQLGKKSGENLTLPAIEKELEKENKKNIYVKTEQTGVVYPMGTLEGKDVFEHECNRDVHAEIILTNGDPLITVRKDNNVNHTYLSLIKKYFEKGGQGNITIVDLQSIQDSNKLIKGNPIPGIGESDILMLDLASESKRRVFRGTGAKSYGSKHCINTNHEKVRKIIDRQSELFEQKEMEQAYKAYFFLLTGKFDRALEYLEQLLLESDKHPKQMEELMAERDEALDRLLFEREKKLSDHLLDILRRLKERF